MSGQAESTVNTLLSQAVGYVCATAKKQGWTVKESQARRARPGVPEAEAAMDQACLDSDAEALKDATRRWWRALGIVG